MSHNMAYPHDPIRDDLPLRRPRPGDRENRYIIDAPTPILLPLLLLPVRVFLRAVEVCWAPTLFLALGIAIGMSYQWTL